MESAHDSQQLIDLRTRRKNNHPQAAARCVERANPAAPGLTWQLRKRISRPTRGGRCSDDVALAYPTPSTREGAKRLQAQSPNACRKRRKHQPEVPPEVQGLIGWRPAQMPGIEPMLADHPQFFEPSLMASDRRRVVRETRARSDPKDAAATACPCRHLEAKVAVFPPDTECLGRLVETKTGDGLRAPRHQPTHLPDRNDLSVPVFPPSPVDGLPLVHEGSKSEEAIEEPEERRRWRVIRDDPRDAEKLWVRGIGHQEALKSIRLQSDIVLDQGDDGPLRHPHAKVARGIRASDGWIVYVLQSGERGPAPRHVLELIANSRVALWFNTLVNDDQFFGRTRLKKDGAHGD